MSRNPRTGREIVIKDVSADNFLQHILLSPEDSDVIATLNLNGDCISDALAAQAGGIGIAPGANIGDAVAMFEATHGTAPGFAGKDQTIAAKALTFDLARLREAIRKPKSSQGAGSVEEEVQRLVPGAKLVGTCGFGEAIARHMNQIDD